MIPQHTNELEKQEKTEITPKNTKIPTDNGNEPIIVKTELPELNNYNDCLGLFD